MTPTPRGDAAPQTSIAELESLRVAWQISEPPWREHAIELAAGLRLMFDSPGERVAALALERHSRFVRAYQGWIQAGDRYHDAVMLQPEHG